MVNTPWKELLADSPRGPQKEVLWSFDPGETTGFSIWQDGELVRADQLKTKTIPDAYAAVKNAHFLGPEPTVVVSEAYHIYKWRTEQHTWSPVHTIQLIGCLKTLTHIWGAPHFEQTAQQAKHFATDEFLQRYGFWIEGKPHARDSLRHAIYFLLFGKDKRGST